MAAAAAAALPAAWDIRTAYPECIWAKTIIDQGGCGSCWAWAATGALASRYCMATKGKVNVRLSPQYLLDCDTEDEMGCGGGALDNVWRYLTDGEHYTVTEECDPYTGQDGKECLEAKCKNGTAAFKKYMATTATPWTPTAAATAAGGPAVVVEMQQELMTHGPLEAGIELFQASTRKCRNHLDFPAQSFIF
jgi:cathepsin B